MRNTSVKSKRVHLDFEESPVFYVALPEHPPGVVPGCVRRTVLLSDIIPTSGSTDVRLDFDRDDKLIGIEFDVARQPTAASDPAWEQNGDKE